MYTGTAGKPSAKTKYVGKAYACSWSPLEPLRSLQDAPCCSSWSREAALSIAVCTRFDSEATGAVAAVSMDPEPELLPPGGDCFAEATACARRKQVARSMAAADSALLVLPDRDSLPDFHLLSGAPRRDVGDR